MFFRSGCAAAAAAAAPCVSLALPAAKVRRGHGLAGVTVGVVSVGAGVAAGYRWVGSADSGCVGRAERLQARRSCREGALCACSTSTAATLVSQLNLAYRTTT